NTWRLQKESNWIDDGIVRLRHRADAIASESLSLSQKDASRPSAGYYLSKGEAGLACDFRYFLYHRIPIPTAIRYGMANKNKIPSLSPFPWVFPFVVLFSALRVHIAH